MKIKYNGEYYKILDSEVPPTYQEFLQTVTETLYIQFLPSQSNLHYRDLEGFPIKVSNNRSYKVMLEERKRFQGELILEMAFDEPCQNIRILLDEKISSVPQVRTNQNLIVKDQQCIEPYLIQSMSQDSVIPGGEKIEGTNASTLKIYNSIPNTIDASVVSLKSENIQREGGEKILEGNSGENERNKESQGRHYQIINTLESVEFIGLGLDMLKEGLSDRLERTKKGEGIDHSEKGTERKKCLRSQRESESFETGKKILQDSVTNQREIFHVDDESDEDFYFVEKKVKPNSSQETLGSLYKDDCLKLDEQIMELQNKWKDDYLIELERSKLKIVAACPNEHDFKLKTGVDDTSIQVVIEELVEIMNAHKLHPETNIVNLTINLKDCPNFSRDGLTSLLRTISSDFTGVCILNLDFSFSDWQKRYHQRARIQSELSLELKYLRSFTLNLKNRIDIGFKDRTAFIEEVQKTSNNSLRFLNVIQP